MKLGGEGKCHEPTPYFGVSCVRRRYIGLLDCGDISSLRGAMAAFYGLQLSNILALYKCIRNICVYNSHGNNVSHYTFLLFEYSNILCPNPPRSILKSRARGNLIPDKLLWCTRLGRRPLNYDRMLPWKLRLVYKIRSILKASCGFQTPYFRPVRFSF